MKVLKLMAGILLTLLAIFKIYTELYSGNFCDGLSGTAEINTVEETNMIAECVNTFFCRFGADTKTYEVKSESGVKQMKNFVCERRF